MKGPKDWLKASYQTHGNSMDGMNKPKSKNMDDTPRSKVSAAGKKNTHMSMTMKAGNKSGGGSAKLQNKSPDRDKRTVYPDSLTTSRKQ